MKYITAEEIEKLRISPEECVKWIKEGLRIKDKCQLPPKMSVHPKGIDFFNTMPCLLPPEFKTFGCKIVSRINGNVPALRSDIMVYDTSTGQLKALMDGNWITAMRTGAVATLAINTFRSTSAKVYSFIGLGVTGNAAIKCLLATNKDEEIVIRLKKYKDQAERTVCRFKDNKNVKFEIVNSIEELIEGADVVVSCVTEAKELFIDDTNKFKKGILVVPVHTRGFQNCDTVFDKVFADDEGHVKGFRHFNEFRSFAEMADVIKGSVDGRCNDEERILSYNIGIGLHDIYFAYNILKKIDQNTIIE